MKVYFISGLGADKNVFKNIMLPAGYDPVFLDWIVPDKDDTLHTYAARMSLSIDTTDHFILIGLSFGGMIASEIASLHQPVKTIIISSITTAEELPWYFKNAGKMGLHKYIPINFLKLATILNRIVGAGTKEDKEVVYNFVRNADPVFVRWSLGAIINWNRKEKHPGVIHLHGTRDHLLPMRYTNPDFIIHKGGHLMVLNRAAEVNKVLSLVLVDATFQNS